MTTQPVAKSIWVQYYSRKKVNGEYVALSKPKYNYRLNYIDAQGREHLIVVTKTEYDQHNLPEKLHDHEPERLEWEKEQQHKQLRTTHSSSYGSPYYSPYYYWR